MHNNTYRCFISLCGRVMDSRFIQATTASPNYSTLIWNVVVDFKQLLLRILEAPGSNVGAETPILRFFQHFLQLLQANARILQ
jgi:hypothetical protein